MRSLKSGLIAIGLAGVLGTVAVVGCSADGGSEIDISAIPTEPGGPADGGADKAPGAVLPPSTGKPSGMDGEDAGNDAGRTDAGRTDAGRTDAGVDAGPPPPVEGASCPTIDAIGTKPCGACGKALSVCLADGATGTGTWSSYGACNDQVAGGCIPGTTVVEDCGNCGKVTRTCNQYCAYTSTTCSGQPANSCAPGFKEYTSAGCATGFRSRECGSTCTFNSFTTTCAEPENANKMIIDSTVGGIVSTTWTLSTANVGKRVTGTCGSSASISPLGDAPFVTVELKNPTAQTATIQVYHSGNGVPLDTVIWAYKKALPPTTDAEYRACDFGVADSCLTGDPCGNAAGGGYQGDWAGLDNIVIPAGGSVLLYNGGYNMNEIGNFNLNVKTKTLN